MKRGKIIVLFAISILLIGLVSAGLIDSIKSALTGKATSQPTNVSVTVTGVNAVNVTVDNSTFTGGVTLIEVSSTTRIVYLTVCDPDGQGDINNSGTQVNFTKVGEASRSNTSCIKVNSINTKCANFSCSVDMWYFDGAGTWIINASATDKGNQTRISNTSYTFTVNELKALVISPNVLNWTSLSPGGTNVGADNDPTVVNNTGNYDGTVKLTGLDLYGDIINTEVFGVANFTADETDGACGAGTALVNNSAQTLSATDTNPGNLSAGAGAGQEQVYYCIPSVPYVSSQQYSTAVLGSWTVAY